MGKMLRKAGSFGKVLADIQARDKTLWQKIKDWFLEIADKLKKAADAYRGMKPDSVEGRMVREMDEVFDEIQKLFAEGLVEASENFGAAEGQKNTTREGGNNNAKNVLYSERNDIVDVNGKEYDSVVMLDKPVPKRVLSDQKAFSKFLANNLFNKKITVLDKNGDVEIIEFAGEKERVSKGGKPRLVRGELTRATGDVRKVIILNLEEVAQLSSYDPMFSSNDHSHGWLDDHGWESRKTFVTDGDMIYEAFLKIGKTADGRNVLYAINCNIENGIAVDKSATSKRAAVRTSNADRKMVTSAPPKVKRNSDRDSSGNILTQEQQEYFRDSVVRDKNGRLLVMYHGTPNGGFTKFRSGTYFTQNPEYADVYQNPGASSISIKKNADAPMTYQVYLDIKKPFDTRKAKERKIFQSEFYRKYGTGTPLADSGLPDWVDGMDLQEFIEEMEYDYDGLILDEGGVGGYGDDVKSRGLSYVVFNSEQVKDVGNKKPTSDPDYRYSERDTMVAELERQNAALQEDVEELKKLLALQGTVTGGRIPKKSSVEAAAKWLKNYAGATLTDEEMKELTGMLTEFYGAILNDDELAWETVAEKAAPIADYIQGKVNIKPQMSEYARDVLRELRGRKIKLSDSQKAEAARAYGSYNEYRKAAFGSVTLSNEGMSLDSVWNEMAKLFPGTFDEDVTAGDQPAALLDVIQGLRSTDQAGKGMRKKSVAAVSRGTLRKAAMGPSPSPNGPPDRKRNCQGWFPALSCGGGH